MSLFWAATIITSGIAVLFVYQTIDTFDEGLLRGKRVVITGASSGIGEQMAYHYARLGAKILITARREQRLQQVIARCEDVGSSNGDYHYLVADMADLQSTQLLIKTAVDRLGGIDFLVLNHIITHPMGEWTGTPQNFSLLSQVLDVNFRAYVHLASHALSYLEESRGTIVVVNSLSGRLGTPYVAAYSASKFAVDGFFSALREELMIRGSNISITCCIIGLIGTDNALTQMRKFGLHYVLDKTRVSPPSEAALAIVRGGAVKKREVFFPYFETKIPTLLKEYIPETLNAFLRVILVRS